MALLQVHSGEAAVPARCCSKLLSGRLAHYINFEDYASGSPSITLQRRRRPNLSTVSHLLQRFGQFYGREIAYHWFSSVHIQEKQPRRTDEILSRSLTYAPTMGLRILVRLRLSYPHDGETESSARRYTRLLSRSLTDYMTVKSRAIANS